MAPEDQRFCAELRAFVAGNVPVEVRSRIAAGEGATHEERVAWERALGARKWLTYTWPAHHGGPGLSVLQQFLFEEITAEMCAPGISAFGVKMVGPVIQEFGTSAQKARHLPGIASGEVGWCQGYSEPGAGSDLASLSTRAELIDGRYVVNGQKIWTSSAHVADWIFMLARTSTENRRQAGISFLLVDMKTSGVIVRPILSADGYHGFNEVFFNDVEVPVENLVGEEGRGWTYAKYLLSHERLGIVAVLGLAQAMRRAEAAANRIDAAGNRIGDEPLLAKRLVDLKIRLRAVEGWTQHALAEMLGGGTPGVEVSLVKLDATELSQDLAEFVMDALGIDALPFAFDDRRAPARHFVDVPDYTASATANHIARRVYTILGGSSEIQKNIVSKAVLGL